MLDERIVVLEEETDLNDSWKQGTRLKKPAGDFNMLVLGKEIVGDKVNGYAVDGNKNAFVSRKMRLMRVEEINDIFDFGWCRGGLVNGRGVGDSIGWKHVNLVCSMIVVVRHKALVPAINVIRG